MVADFFQAYGLETKRSFFRPRLVPFRLKVAQGEGPGAPCQAARRRMLQLCPHLSPPGTKWAGLAR